MKKALSLFLALFLLTLSCCAFAADGDDEPSRTGEDLIHTEILNPMNDFRFIIIPGAPDAMAELEKLEAETDRLAFFGPVRDAIVAITGPNGAVKEFAGCICENYEESMGPMTVGMSFPKPFEEGARVAVVIKAGDEWTVFEAGGSAAGSVTVTFDPATLLKIQEGGGMIAVIA